MSGIEDRAQILITLICSTCWTRRLSKQLCFIKWFSLFWLQSRIIQVKKCRLPAGKVWWSRTWWNLSGSCFRYHQLEGFRTWLPWDDRKYVFCLLGSLMHPETVQRRQWSWTATTSGGVFFISLSFRLGVSELWIVRGRGFSDLYLFLFLFNNHREKHFNQFLNPFAPYKKTMYKPMYNL